ncbi:site-specific integrase [Aureibaculum sp. A20]|uniref:Site-specific integrase n=1 Tax=Aureibaculum flavum TaxID=2795986 RepID=A0ABS0WP09_9FLAO|nr:site-specific integrase [Aureibaculum flavum]MBJ2173676.1 site-specific integrase [Aureibaculum flavum]
MRATNTFSAIFWVDQKNAKNKQALIYARVTVNQKRVSISTKRKVSLSLWNQKTQKAKGNSIEARQINQYLTQVQSQLFQCYQDLKFKGNLITAKLIKANYLGEGGNSKTLQNLMEYHSQNTKDKLASGTIRNFEVTERYINKFLEKNQKTTDIFLNALDYKFVCDFSNFLQSYWPKGHPKTLSNNTVMKHIQRFRKIVTLGYHIEWLDRDPFIRWKPSYEKRERPFLTDNELSSIETYELPIERLERVRDLFVFSCYTGISYSDIMNLTSQNILKGIDGNEWIFTNRQKTKSPIKVPILDKALKLITKYHNHPMAQISGTLFPVITNEKLNQYLKEVAFYCGIKKNLTFHMARHTFATTVTLSNGVPIETVSKLLGHKKIATTQIYARVIERKISEDMSILKSKLGLASNENKISS